MHQSSTSQVYYYKFNITKFNIPTAATETAGVAPPDCGEGPDYGEGLTRSAAGDTVAGLFEPADGGYTKEKRFY